VLEKDAYPELGGPGRKRAASLVRGIARRIAHGPRNDLRHGISCGSISKTFVALALLKLQEEGKLISMPGCRTSPGIP